MKYLIENTTISVSERLASIILPPSPTQWNLDYVITSELLLFLLLPSTPSALSCGKHDSRWFGTEQVRHHVSWHPPKRGGLRNGKGGFPPWSRASTQHWPSGKQYVLPIKTLLWKISFSHQIYDSIYQRTYLKQHFKLDQKAFNHY